MGVEAEGRVEHFVGLADGCYEAHEAAAAGDGGRAGLVQPGDDVVLVLCGGAEERVLLVEVDVLAVAWAARSGDVGELRFQLVYVLVLAACADQYSYYRVLG